LAIFALTLDNEGKARIRLLTLVVKGKGCEFQSGKKERENYPGSICV
jgi:hypothetical protein